MAKTEDIQEQAPTEEAPQESDSVQEAEQTADAESQPDVQVQQAEFTEAVSAPAAGSEEHLDVLLDVQLPVSITLGKTQLPFRRLMQLGPGSVLPLNKRIGQPVELRVQDIPIATGDVVVVNDCFAVRIREILNAESTDTPAVSQETQA